MAKLTVEERFLEKVRIADNGCWLWTGKPRPDGYGSFNIEGRRRLAHVAAYELFIGAVPLGMEIDHLCHTRDLTCPGGVCIHRLCVNPFRDLEAVPGRVNTLRSRSVTAVNAVKTHCSRNHPYDEANTYWRLDRRGRCCRACNREIAARRAARKRSGA